MMHLTHLILVVDILQTDRGVCPYNDSYLFKCLPTFQSPVQICKFVNFFLTLVSYNHSLPIIEAI